MSCGFYLGYQEPLTERHVQALWYDAEMRPATLRARNGEEITVISPGEWNLGPGPDFHHAVIEIGKEHVRLVGDVEVHLSPSDWNAHGHGHSPLYRNVIAHVTWGCGPVPDTLPSTAISIWYGRYFTSDPGFSPAQVDLSAYPFARLPLSHRPCHEEILKNPESAREVLRAAGVFRIYSKARRMAGLLARRHGNRRQLFYEEIMSALGYRQNQSGFRQVATAVPIDVLEREPESAAGAFQVAADFYEWHLKGSRPNNQPLARLRNAAAIFTRTDTMRLLEEDDFSERGCRRMVKTMTDGRFLGRGRAAAVLTNIILPFALALKRVDHVPDWLPPEDVSHPVRLSALRLLGRDHNPMTSYGRNNLLLQGLIQIHRDFCLQVHPACCDCRLVQTLRAA